MIPGYYPVSDVSPHVNTLLKILFSRAALATDTTTSLEELISSLAELEVSLAAKFDPSAGHGHDGIDSKFIAGIKGWVNFNGIGTIAINDNFNVDSVTDNGTGDYTIIWTTDFANTAYCVVGTCDLDPSNVVAGVQTVSFEVGFAQIYVMNHYGAAGTVKVDVDRINIIAIGDQ